MRLIDVLDHWKNNRYPAYYMYTEDALDMLKRRGLVSNHDIVKAILNKGEKTYTGFIDNGKFRRVNTSFFTERDLKDKENFRQFRILNGGVVFID